MYKIEVKNDRILRAILYKRFAWIFWKKISMVEGFSRKEKMFVRNQIEGWRNLYEIED